MSGAREEREGTQRDSSRKAAGRFVEIKILWTHGDFSLLSAWHLQCSLRSTVLPVVVK